MSLTSPSPNPDSPHNQPTTKQTAKDAADLYFKGEIEACGYTFVTDSKWTCSGHPPADDKWLDGAFDDSKWERAVWVRSMKEEDGSRVCMYVCVCVDR